MMISLFASMFLGAILNRIRGSDISNGGTINIVVFTLLCPFFLPESVTSTSSLVFLCFGAAVGMWAGQQQGWGRYIGATGGWESQKLEQVNHIDKMTEYLKPTTYDMYSKNGDVLRVYRPRISLVRWGFCSLSLRGLYWGICIFMGIATSTLAGAIFFGGQVALPHGVIIFSPLMGVVYLTSFAVLQYIEHEKYQDGWRYSEYAYGAILWASIFA